MVWQLLKKIGDGMGGSILFACQDWAGTKAAYRFSPTTVWYRLIFSVVISPRRVRVSTIVKTQFF